MHVAKQAYIKRHKKTQSDGNMEARKMDVFTALTQYMWNSWRGSHGHTAHTKSETGHRDRNNAIAKLDTNAKPWITETCCWLPKTERYMIWTER